MSDKSRSATVKAYRLIAGFTDSSVAIAALLFDSAEDKLHMFFRPDLEEVIPEEELEVVQLMEEDLKKQMVHIGAGALVVWMEDTLSGYVRLEGPDWVSRPDDWELALRQMLADAAPIKQNA